MKGLLRSPARFAGLSKDSAPSARYSIVIGSYRDRANAMKYSEKLTSDGYPAEAVSFRNGFTAVGVCPTDDPSELLASLRKVRKERFCPKEVWILVNE
jgi:cell division septation protein DedD